MFTGQLSLKEETLVFLLHMMRFLALICAPTRLDYIVTANVAALHLALHQDLLEWRWCMVAVSRNMVSNSNEND